MEGANVEALHVAARGRERVEGWERLLRQRSRIPNTSARRRFPLSPFRTQTPGHAMPIDHFFRSVAEDQGSTAIGVILSGTGSDGTLGLAAWNWSANPRLVAPSFSNRTRSESYVGQCPLCTPATQKASPRRILAKPDFLAFLRILKCCVPIPDTWRPEPELPAIRRV